MPTTRNMSSLKPRTLEGACNEALLEAGFSYIVEAQSKVTYSLWDYLDTLANSDGQDCEDYVRFGNHIVRLSDAWKGESEVYELLY